jgi:hypothetical protein
VLAYSLVLAIATLVLYKLTGGLVEGRQSWLERPHLDEQLKLRQERHSKGKQRTLF